MPIRSFWLFYRNVERIMALHDLHVMNVSTVAFAKADQIKEVRRSLVLTIGDEVKAQTPQLSETLDRKGMHELRAMLK